MSIIFNQQENAQKIEKELQRFAVAIHFNWNKPEECISLAQEFKLFNESISKEYMNSGDLRLKNKALFFGLVHAMFKVMTEGATDYHTHIHGGVLWKSFARALYSLN